MVLIYKEVEVVTQRYIIIFNGWERFLRLPLHPLNIYNNNQMVVLEGVGEGLTNRRSVVRFTPGTVKPVNVYCLIFSHTNTSVKELCNLLTEVHTRTHTHTHFPICHSVL